MLPVDVRSDDNGSAKIPDTMYRNQVNSGAADKASMGSMTVRFVETKVFGWND
jgi:hypothetical protein